MSWRGSPPLKASLGPLKGKFERFWKSVCENSLWYGHGVFLRLRLCLRRAPITPAGTLRLLVIPLSRLLHRWIARIRAARCSSVSASLSRFVARYSAARFPRLEATLGWSGPRAFSQIARARL